MRVRKYSSFTLTLADDEDKQYLHTVAREVRYRSTSSFIRAVLNGYCKMMGFRKLKPLYPTCVGAKLPFCRKGHPLTEDNLSYKNVHGVRRRLCKICYRATQKRAWQKANAKRRAA